MKAMEEERKVEVEGKPRSGWSFFFSLPRLVALCVGKLTLTVDSSWASLIVGSKANSGTKSSIPKPEELQCHTLCYYPRSH